MLHLLQRCVQLRHLDLIQLDLLFKEPGELMEGLPMLFDQRRLDGFRLRVNTGSHGDSRISKHLSHFFGGEGQTNKSP